MTTCMWSFIHADSFKKGINWKANMYEFNQKMFVWNFQIISLLILIIFNLLGVDAMKPQFKVNIKMILI